METVESLHPSPRNYPYGALLLSEENPPPQGLNGQPFLREHVDRVLDIDLNTDAGGRGWAVVLAAPPAGTVAESALLEVVSSRLLRNMTIQAVASALRTGLKLRCTCL